MQELFEQLIQIESILEQIDDITENQTTVLIGSRNTLEEENNAIDIMNQMIDAKEELMNQLTMTETNFQESYAKKRRYLTNKEIVDTLQARVGAILKKKQIIVEREQNNLVIMQSYVKAKEGPLKLTPRAIDVANAYKKHQPKT